MQSLPRLSILRVERQGFCLHVTMDDPATRNAMSDTLVGEWEAVLDATADDRTLRAMVVRGANGVFCAGADLKNVDSPGSGGERDPAWLANRRGGLFFRRMNEHPLAVVAVVEGPAIGGGMGLVCCADVVICTPDARFALSETSLGLVPAQIAPYVVARLGIAAARRLTLTASRFDGLEALQLGLADYCVESSEALAETLATVLRGVERCAPEANALAKSLMLRCAYATPLDYVDLAADAFSACVAGQEGQEGVRAFRERRPPNWVGPR
ncbi:MAG TPA: enoyl-CoA hydratase/isomerase family protein [Caulobacteraceae bacterium]|nr:enoyl-CoA hydratase/isomerase family protein [Caulobacteraceae bacterium]